MLSSIYRSHTCGELNIENVGAGVKLAGWVHNIRDHGGVLRQVLGQGHVGPQHHVGSVVGNRQQRPLLRARSSRRVVVKPRLGGEP